MLDPVSDPAPMNALICEAIRARRLLMFGYADTVRVVEPHLYGVNTAGHEALSAWLRPGHSRSDPRGGWRMYLTDEIREMQMLDERFAEPRPGYNPADPHVPRIFCRLEAAALADADADRPAAHEGG